VIESCSVSTNHVNNEVAGPCRHKPENLRCLSCILDDSDYFSGLSLKAKLDLQKSMQLVTLEKRNNLYTEGKPSDKLYILVSGAVKVYKSLMDGRQQIHKIVSIPGDLLACEDLFLDTHNSTAMPLEETRVCYLKKSSLMEAMHQHREISQTLMQSMARNLNSYIKHVANLGQKTALERVASYLIFLHETHIEKSLRHDTLEESLTRTELGEVLGITQRTLIRSLKQLETTQLISLAKNGFIILDLAALKRISECG
jgi:CRP/FNR family transcriptional regulator, anaerobic regulatory protein